MQFDHIHALSILSSPPPPPILTNSLLLSYLFSLVDPVSFPRVAYIIKGHSQGGGQLTIGHTRKENISTSFSKL